MSFVEQNQTFRQSDNLERGKYLLSVIFTQKVSPQSLWRLFKALFCTVPQLLSKNISLQLLSQKISNSKRIFSSFFITHQINSLINVWLFMKLINTLDQIIMQHIQKDNSKAKHKRSKHTKTKLLNNGRLLVEGTFHDLDSYIEDTDDSNFLIEYSEENSVRSRGQIKQEQKKVTIKNFSFDEKTILTEEIQDREYVEELAILGCTVNKDTIRQLVRLEWWNLKSLTISKYYYHTSHIKQHLTDRDVRAFMGKEWPVLEKLNLFDNRLGDPGLKFILTTSYLPNLKELEGGVNEITQSGLQSILSTKLTNLTMLGLNFNKIGSAGIKLLVKANLPNLEVLKLTSCGLGDEGVKHLTKGHWPNLHKISINHNHVSFTGYQAIALNNWLKLSEFLEMFYLCDCCGGYIEKLGIDLSLPNIAAFSLIGCCQTSVKAISKVLHRRYYQEDFKDWQRSALEQRNLLTQQE